MNEIDAISSLSDKDYIEIVSTWSSMSNDQFDCRSCKALHIGDVGLERRRTKGCFESTKTNLAYKPEGVMKGSPKILYERCPGNYFSYYWSQIISYHSTWEKGVLPYPGSYWDQPSKFVEAMNLVNNLKLEKQENDHKKLSKYGTKRG